ncbi:type IV pilin-like G/H family protein [Nodosilinea sp. AN01ver1]|uniref:type IV pilin-like G/H family protein n=1 Tax=Nodosilinea sp. AN01ver1 TaxID=3423362 RepID=UPI003D321F71
MVAANPMELAKQGDADAIAALMNKALKSRGITVSGKATKGCLTIVAESKEAPDQTFLTDYLSKGVKSINPVSLERMVVQGKEIGQSKIVWRENVNLKISEPEKKGKIAEAKNKLGVFRSVLDIANTALLGGILLTLIGSQLRSTPTQTPFWEYTIEGVSDESFTETMLEMGAKGWDLASARRAVNGEGSYSEGLYEVIFKRPISESEAKSNLKNIEIIGRENGIESFLSLTNNEQELNYIQNDVLSRDFNGTEAFLQDDSDNYAVEIAQSLPELFVVNATAKSNNLRSFVSAVAVVDNSTETIICKADEPGKTLPDPPQVVDGSLECAVGSFEP